MSDPNYPARWDDNAKRWYRSQWNYVTQQWEFLDWLDWPAPIDRRDSHVSNAGPAQIRVGRAVQGTYDADNAATSHYERLDPSFFVRDASFFQEGRLFSVLFTEAAGQNALNAVTDYNTAISRVRYNEFVHTQVRRFIVTKKRRAHCDAVPIFTYSGQGTKKPGVVADEHSIAYSYGYSPEPLDGEDPLTKHAICIVMNENERPLAKASRIFFGIQHPIQYNVKVKDLGYVHPDWMPTFLGYWAMEHGVATEQAAEVTAEAHGH